MTPAARRPELPPSCAQSAPYGQGGTSVSSRLHLMQGSARRLACAAACRKRFREQALRHGRTCTHPQLRPGSVDWGVRHTPRSVGRRGGERLVS
jgi:hypothetical protein